MFIELDKSKFFNPKEDFREDAVGKSAKKRLPKKKKKSNFDKRRLNGRSNNQSTKSKGGVYDIPS